MLKNKKSSYDVDSPEFYTQEEIEELIGDYGIGRAVHLMDFHKIKDSKLRSWFEQLEKIVDKIEDKLFNTKIVIKPEPVKIYGRKEAK